MSKRQRTSPSREMRSALPGAKRGPADPLFMAREIVAALADAVVVTGADRRIVTANRAAAELFGRPLEDMPGTAIDDLVAVAERERVAELEQRARGGEDQRYETKVVRSDRAERDVAVSATPLVVEGELVGTVVMLRDIIE